MIIYMPVSAVIVGFAYIALFIAAFALLGMAASRKMYGFMGAMVGVGLVTLAGLQCILEISDAKREVNRELLMRISPSYGFIYIIILAVAIGVAEILMGISFFKWNKTHVTRQSIAEALNGFTEGICCYYPGGQILLINHFMSESMEECCGKRCTRNGEWIHKAVFEGILLEGCQRVSIQGETAVMLPNKKVLLMKEDSVTMRGEDLRIISAMDITEEYHKTEELYEEQRELKEITKKLLDYNREVVDLVASKEVLNAKMKIHDSLGEELLIMRHYIEGASLQGKGDYPERGDNRENEKQTIINMLERSLSFLLDENSSEKKDEYELMIETARDLGVQVIVDGTLPEEKEIKRILSSGIHICFTNTIRHAKGDKLFVKVRSTEKGIAAEFKNNGLAPAGPIQEKGGLKTLRELVEKAGGQIVIEHMPEFRLEVFVPEENAE